MSQISKRAISGGGGGDVNTLTGNDGIVVGADGSGNINVIGDATYLRVTGNAGTFTETIAPINPLIVVYKSPLIDMTVAAATLSFNIPHDFVISQIFFRQVTLTGTTQIPSFSIGWTAPNYDDSDIQNLPMPSYPIPVNSMSAVDINDATQNGYFVPLPANTDIYINVTMPDIATSDTMYFYLSGYYLF